MDKKEQLKIALDDYIHLRNRWEWILSEQRRLASEVEIDEPTQHMIDYYKTEVKDAYDNYMESFKTYLKIEGETKDIELEINLLQCIN